MKDINLLSVLIRDEMSYYTKVKGMEGLVGNLEVAITVLSCQFQISVAGDNTYNLSSKLSVAGDETCELCF